MICKHDKEVINHFFSFYLEVFNAMGEADTSWRLLEQFMGPIDHEGDELNISSSNQSTMRCMLQLQFHLDWI